MNSEYDFEVIDHITFSKKPIPVSPYYRPLYKIIQLALVLKISSYKKSASLLKLHMFSWTMNSKDEMTRLLNYVEKKFTGEITLWRSEPSLNRALAFGIAEGLFSYKNNKYCLAPNGDKIVNIVLKDEDLFIEEKEFLNLIGKTITEKKVSEMTQSIRGI